MSQFIATTPLHLMRPLGSPAERSLPRVRAILEREFHGRVRFELAEPVQRKDGTGIDWYTENDDTLTQLIRLPPELADHYLARLKSDVDMVNRAAGGHEARSEAAGQTTATTLRNAVTYPGQDNVWVAGDVESGEAQVILTAWGYEPHASDAGVTDISKRAWVPPTGAVDIARNAEADRAELPRQASATVAARASIPVLASSRWRLILAWLLWLLIPLLALTIGWLLLPACGLRLPFGGLVLYGWGDGVFCRQIASADATRDDSLTRDLMSEVETLEAQLRALLVRCVQQPKAEQLPENPQKVFPNNQQTDQEQKKLPDTDRAAAQEAEDLLKDHNIKPGQNDTDVSLIWRGQNDLDLYVVCPDGKNVPLGPNGATVCGAKHELDMNYTTHSDKPVEHVSWGDRSLPPGHYRIQVKYYQHNLPEALETPFMVILHKDGKYTVERKSAPTEKDLVPVMEFDVP